MLKSNTLMIKLEFNLKRTKQKQKLLIAFLYSKRNLITSKLIELRIHPFFIHTLNSVYYLFLMSIKSLHVKDNLYFLRAIKTVLINAALRLQHLNGN